MHPHDPPLPEEVLTPAILVVGDGLVARAAAAAAWGACADVLVLHEAPLFFERDRRASTAPVLHAAAWGAFAGPEIAALSATRRFLLRPRQLILAQSPGEAPCPLPGWTLPGCTATGALLGGATANGGPDGPVVIAGNGPFNLQAAADLVRAGARISAVAEAAWPGSLRVARRALAVLRRAGVPVLWGTRPVQVLGTHRVEGLLVATPGGLRTIPAATVALHWGFQPETGLARLLGVPHRLAAGQLEAETDAEGRTSLPGVFVIDGPAGVDTVWRAKAAGRAAARALGFRAPPPRAALRAERRQRRITLGFAAARPDPVTLPDETVICPCEAVCVGTIRRAQADGAASLPAVKRATRAGMGPCGGRLCAAAIGRLCHANAEAAFAAPRVPLRPVLAGLLMAGHDDPADAVLPLPATTSWNIAPPGPLPGGAEVVVVGAGIVGLATALYLARDGVDVLLLDRAEPGLAASTANAGSLHVQLVPYVYAAGNGGPMADSLPLGPASIALWRELARDANEDLGLRTEGGLVLAETAAEMDLLRAKTAFERSRGVPCEVVGPDDLRQIAPDLDGRFAGAAFCPSEGQGDPLRGTMALLALARRAGVRLAPGVEVLGLKRDDRGWQVRTGAGTIQAGQVVNAAGVQAGRIGALAGATVPVHALVQQVVATERARPMLRQLVAWTGRHLSLKQGNGGHLLIGGGWPGTQDRRGAAQVRRDSLEGNLALAAQALPGLCGVRVVRAWTGLAPTLGRAPVISGTPGLPGLWHGVTGNGYTLGPVVGRMLADAVRGRTPLPLAFSL